MLSDPANRAARDKELMRNSTTIANLVVAPSASAANRRYEGLRLREIASAESKTLTDTLLDIAVVDDLETESTLTGLIHTDDDKVIQLLDHSGMHIGAADAGAHHGVLPSGRHLLPDRALRAWPRADEPRTRGAAHDRRHRS
jgi:N-acyl-D-aspartate/D-glutamate deacylase